MDTHHYRLPLLLASLIFSLLLLKFAPRPCSKPISYQIGNVDERFGLSRQEFSEAAEAAISLWQKATNRRLFQEKPHGAISIHLIYDYRQAAFDRMKSLGIKLGRSREDCEAMRNRFDALKKDYEEKARELQREAAEYAPKVSTFNARMAQVPLPEAEFRSLQGEKSALDTLRLSLEQRHEAHKKLGEELLGMAVVINEIAEMHNLNALDFNVTSKSLGNEFSQGLYERQAGTENITIYHFEDNTALVRVLAHEFGHALGLGHLDNPKALMNRLAATPNAELTDDDIAAIKKRCQKWY